MPFQAVLLYRIMQINYEKQRALGYAGLALLRNWLIGNTASIVSIFKEISFISETEKDVYDASAQKATEHEIEAGYNTPFP